METSLHAAADQDYCQTALLYCFCVGTGNLLAISSAGMCCCSDCPFFNNLHDDPCNEAAVYTRGFPGP